jgi:hypothetical protein
MATTATSLELRFIGCDYGLSARRLWEFTEMGQINPFERAISERRELNDAPSFIDVVQFDGDNFSLAGFTLAQLLANNIPPDSVIGGNALLCRQFKSDQGNAFVSRGGRAS